MKVFVKLMYLCKDIGCEYIYKVGEVIDVKRNYMNFTKVLVRFEDSKEFEISPSFIEITTNREQDGNTFKTK